MKILQIVTLLPFPPTDGGKLSIYGLIKSLSESGHDIELKCYQTHDDYETCFNALKQFCKSHILNFKTENSVVKAVKNLFLPVPYNASKCYSKLILNYTKRLLTEKSFDIVQISRSHLDWLAPHRSIVTDIPIIMRSTSNETMIMKRYSEQVRNLLLRSYSWLQYKKLIRRTTNLFRIRFMYNH